MKTTHSILLLLSFELLSCVGTKSILEQAVQNANKETLAVSLVEHADGNASYEVRSKSGLEWVFPTIEYHPSATGVAEMKHRDYYQPVQISSPNRSVIAIQEYSNLAHPCVSYAKERFRNRTFPVFASYSTVYAVFVARGGKGTLYSIGKARGSFVSGGAADSNGGKITGLSSSGILMGNMLFKWKDTEVRNVRDIDALTRDTED